MQIKATLIDAVKNRQAVLFAGAGISWKAIGFGGQHIRDQVGMEIKRDSQATTMTAARSKMSVMSMPR